MVDKRDRSVTAEALRREIADLVLHDHEDEGAWCTFTFSTLKDMQLDYDVTMEYLSTVTKEQYDFVCEAIEEVVYHFQKLEMVELLETLYDRFYGHDRDTAFYRDNIKPLRDCIKIAKGTG